MTKKLPTHLTVISLTVIFLIALSFFGVLYYLLNIQYQKPKNLFLRGGPVTSAPKILMLEVDQPDDNILVFNSSLLISGNTLAGSTVLISDQSHDLILTPKSDGSFSTVLNLDEGVNKITVYTFDDGGDQKSKNLTVYYSKEKI